MEFLSNNCINFVCKNGKVNGEKQTDDWIIYILVFCNIFSLFLKIYIV